MDSLVVAAVATPANTRHSRAPFLCSGRVDQSARDDDAVAQIVRAAGDRAADRKQQEPCRHDEAMDASAAETAKLYREWARVEVHGSSLIYERLALAVAEDPAILELLSKVE